MLSVLKRTILGAVLSLAIASPALAGSHIYKLYVDGLACPFCAYGVEKQVGSLKNVEAIDILIDQGVVSVTMKPGTTLDQAVAKQAVSDAGFTLRKFANGSTQ